MTKKEFIERATEIYGNTYDYKSVPDTNIEPFNNIPIYCSKHGLFYQSVYDHLLGKGCFDCWKEGK